MSAPFGRRLLGAVGWLCGDEPADRFLAPLVADVQADVAAARARGAGAVRGALMRGYLDVACVLPHVVARARPSSAVGWAWPPLVAASLGLVALSVSAGETPYLRLQLGWLAAALVAFVVVRAVGRRLLAMGPGTALAVCALAVLPPILTGERWMRFGHLVVAWSELARPVFLLVVAAAARHRRGALVASVATLAWLSACARIHEPASAVLTAISAAAALSTYAAAGEPTSGSGRSLRRTSSPSARGARLGMAVCACAGVAAALVAMPAWGLSWLEGASPWRASIGAVRLDGHTDAVLTSLALRTGLAGAAVALAALVAVALAPIRAASAPEVARPLAAGLLVQITAHVGAVAGVLPSFGVALPLVSYGGSAAVAVVASLALAAAAVPARSPRTA